MKTQTKYRVFYVMLITLLAFSGNLFAEQNTGFKIKTAIGEPLESFQTLEWKKFTVLASAGDLGVGRIITSCENAACKKIEANYDTTTIVSLPNNKIGTTRDLLNFSAFHADIMIRKADQHIHKISLYK